MDPLKIYTDEDVDVSVSKALRLRRIEAITTLKCKNLGATDAQQLQFAASQHAVLLTHNISDFAALHYEYIASGGRHYGIILAKQNPVGELVKALLELSSKFSKTAMINRLEYLSNY